MSKSDNSKTMFAGAQAKSFEYARENRSAPTIAEGLLWEELKASKLGVKFRRQHPISQFIVDFYYHRMKLIIEVDGEYHLDEEQKEHDLGREQMLEELDCRVARFRNHEVIDSIAEVITSIKIEIDDFK